MQQLFPYVGRYKPNKLVMLVQEVVLDFSSRTSPYYHVGVLAAEASERAALPALLALRRWQLST